MKNEDNAPNIDNELIKKCQEGDTEAFHDIYGHFKNKVFGTAFRFTNNQEEAADLTQDIFVNIFKKIKMFEFKSAFSTWVYRIAVNMSIDRIRKLRRYSISSIDDPDFALTDGFRKAQDEHQLEAPEEAFQKTESAGKAQKAIAKLSPKLRAIVVLRYIDDLPYNEIAQILKCSEGTVKSRLNRAHAKLKELLGKEV